MISKSELGAIHTTIYSKPTATNSLLHWDSSHPLSLKRGIPYGQYLRIRRNCSTRQEFIKQSKDLRKRFLQKGYPDSVLRRAYRKALEKDSPSLLLPTSTNDNSMSLLPLRIVGTFDDSSVEIRSIIKRHWHNLTLDPDLREAVGASPSITFRRGRNLRDHLVHSHYSAPSTTNTWLQR